MPWNMLRINMTFKELKIGDKFRFGPREAVICIKVADTTDLHDEAGLAVYSVSYATKVWPVWNEEEVIKII